MNRTSKMKIGYWFVLIILACLAFYLISIFSYSPYIVILVGLIFVIPGRIQGHYYKELFTGRKLSDKGYFEKALLFYERFLAKLNNNPYLGWLLWFSWSIYTPSTKAMTKNNIGVANLELGHLVQAESSFLDALSCDPKYPLPHYNLAIIYEIHGDKKASVDSLQKALELGFRNGTTEQVINKAQSLLAKIEGGNVVN